MILASSWPVTRVLPPTLSFVCACPAKEWVIGCPLAGATGLRRPCTNSELGLFLHYLSKHHRLCNPPYVLPGIWDFVAERVFFVCTYFIKNYYIIILFSWMQLRNNIFSFWILLVTLYCQFAIEDWAKTSPNLSRNNSCFWQESSQPVFKGVLWQGWGHWALFLLPCALGNGLRAVANFFIEYRMPFFCTD